MLIISLFTSVELTESLSPAGQTKGRCLGGSASVGRAAPGGVAQLINAPPTREYQLTKEPIHPAAVVHFGYIVMAAFIVAECFVVERLCSLLQSDCVFCCRVIDY